MEEVVVLGKDLMEILYVHFSSSSLKKVEHASAMRHILKKRII